MQLQQDWSILEFDGGLSLYLARHPDLKPIGWVRGDAEGTCQVTSDDIARLRVVRKFLPEAFGSVVSFENSIFFDAGEDRTLS